MNGTIKKIFRVLIFAVLVQLILASTVSSTSILLVLLASFVIFPAEWAHLFGESFLYFRLFRLSLRLAEFGLAVDCDDASCLFLKSASLMSLAQYEEALVVASRLVEVYPNLGSSWLHRSIARYWCNDAMGAESDASKAIAMGVRDLSVFQIRSYARTRTNRADRFLLAYEDADMSVKVAPRDPNSYSLRSYSRFQRNDLEGSMEDALKCLQLEKDHATALAICGVIALACSDYAEAERIIALTSKLNRDSSILSLRVQYFLKRRMLQAAIRDAEDLIEIEPQEPIGFFVRAEALTLQNKGLSAQAYIEMCRELFPWSHLGFYARSHWLVRQERFEEALTELARTDEQNPEFLISHDLRAFVLWCQGKHESALEESDRQVGQPTADAFCYAVRSICLAENNRLEEAREASARSSELDPEEPATYLALAVAEIKQGNLEQACAYLDESLALDPFGAASLRLKAVTLDKIGETGKAKDAWAKYRSTLEDFVED
ncbi:MAG: tetratricopeptide repeat protein [Candidatus Obscuribacterales bacterium]